MSESPNGPIHDYDPAYLEFRNKLVLWSNHAEPLIKTWQELERRHKPGPPEDVLRRLRTWVTLWE